MFPAWLRIVGDDRAHFFDDPELAMLAMTCAVGYTHPMGTTL